MAPAVARLVTLVDVDDRVADANEMAVAVLHEAVLPDGARVVLLADRGWSEHGPDIWAGASSEAISRTARMVVGPDEPLDGRSYQAMEADHWAYLQRILGQHGVAVDVAELGQLPHEVVLSARLRARIRASSHSSGQG